MDSQDEGQVDIKNYNVQKIFKKLVSELLTPSSNDIKIKQEFIN